MKRTFPRILALLCILLCLSLGTALAASTEVTASHKSGAYDQPFSLTLRTSKGEIWYTTDGSDPTSSETARRYDGPIAVTDRSGDANIVSAVDPLLFSGSFNYLNGNTFMTRIKPPADSAVDKCTVIRAAVKTNIHATQASTTPDETYGIIGTAEKLTFLVRRQLEKQINRRLSRCTTQCPVQENKRT